MAGIGSPAAWGFLGRFLARFGLWTEVTITGRLVMGQAGPLGVRTAFLQAMIMPIS
jgi:hypothetical protein